MAERTAGELPHDPATEDFNKYVKPGRERAPLYRYFQFNLPRLTRAVLLLMLAGIGALALAVRLNLPSGLHTGWLTVMLPVTAVVALLVAVIGAVTVRDVWNPGGAAAMLGLVTWLVALAGRAPFTWEGAGLYVAAGWNLMMFLSLGYLVLLAMLRVRIIVAYPDDQGFED